MNKNKRNSKKVLAAICAFSGAFGGNSGASAALKNKKVPTVKTDVKSNVKSKNLSLNRQSGNKNFFGKAWDLIKANPVKSSLITAGGLTVAVGTPLLIAKLIKGKKDDKDPNKKNKKEIKKNQEKLEDKENKKIEEIKENKGDKEIKEEIKEEKEIKEEIKENQEIKEEIKKEEIKEIKEEIKKEEIKEIKEGNQPPQQQPKDNFKLHFDSLKINSQNANNANQAVWKVLNNCGIKNDDPVKIYCVGKDLYAVCIKDSSNTKDKLKKVDYTFLTFGPKKEKISDFHILCIKNTALVFGTNLNIVDPKVHFSFSILGTDNLGIKVNQ